MVIKKRATSAVLALALAAAAAFVLMPRLNDATVRAVSSGLAAFRAQAEGVLGLSLSFESLSPSILSSASFSRLSISVPGGRTLLYARKVRVLYNLVAVIRGKGSESITGLELADVTLDLRLPEDDAQLARLSALLVGGGGGGYMPKLVVSGKNVAATVTLAGKGSASFIAREIGLSTFENEPVVTLDGRFSLEPAGDGMGAISGPLSLSGSISRDLRRARLGLSIAADSRDFSLSTQRFELVYGNDELALTKVKDRAPIDAAVRINFAGGESSASFKLDGYALSRSLRVAARYASLKPWLDIPYKGSLFLKAPGIDFSKLSYETALSGSLPARLFRGGGSSARAVLVVRGDANSASIEKARVERGSDFIEYSGIFRFRDLAPDGLLDLRLPLVGGTLAVASSLRLVGEGGEYAVMADQATVGDAVFKDISLAVARKGAQADFSLSFRPPDSAESSDAAAAAAPDVPAARFSGEAGASNGLHIVRVEGSASFDAHPNLELTVDLEAVDLGPLKDLLSALTGSPGAGALLSNLKLGGSLFMTSDFKRLSWSASDLTIVSRRVAGTYALLSLSGTTTSMVIKKAVVSFPGYSIEGSGKADFADPRRLGFEAKLSLKDIPYSIQGSVAGQDVSITGDYGLAAYAHTAGGESYVSLRSRALPLPLAGGLFLATLDAEGRFASLEDWALSVSDLALVPVGEKMSVMPKVELAGDFGPSSGGLSSLRVEDKYSAVSGKAALSYSLSGPLSARITARLSSAPALKMPSATESYNLDLSYSGGRCEGFIDLVASPLARLGKLPIEGSADGRLSIRGDIGDPTLDFSLSLRDGLYREQTLALAGAGSYGKGVLELRGVTAAYQGQSINDGAVRLSFADAKVDVSMAYSGSFGGESLKFSLAAQGASTRAGAGGTLAERLASYEATGSLSGLSLGKVAVGTWPFNASVDAKAASFVGGSSGELRFNYAANGVFSASLRNPLPVRAEVSGLYDGKNIDLSVQGLEFDLGLLSPLMPADLIKLVGGKARGGFRAIGLANDPEITGEIDLEGASVKVLGWVADDIGPFNAPIVAVGRKVSVSVLQAPSGKASVALACQATFDHWLPAGLTASARTIAGTSLHLDSVILGIHAKGDASADVRFALQGDVLFIDADVALEKATVVVSTETLASGDSGETSKPALSLMVATNVHFGRGVQVFFPSTTFPIVAGYSDPSSSLAIRYDQATTDFSLKGTVALRGGEVFYVQRNFFLKDGKIVFNEGSDRFEPRVTLLAEMRDRNDEGPVLIILKADNAPISSFKPTLSSDPVMTEAQIAALMGQNVFGTSGDSSFDIRKTAISASEFIPQLNVTRAFENQVRDVFGLDIFYLRTQVLQNWLIDISGQSATASGNPLARYFDQTSIYAGKYLNDSIFAYGSMGVQESAPLVGTVASIINWELGVELDAPFGRLTWALAPEDWKTLKFSDQSLSLSWKLSY
jgi:translocation and assembly module TamB